MARSQRSAKLETRTARLKLPPGIRHYVTISRGLALAYRRTEDGYGTWQARVWTGTEYLYRALGVADDYQEADGESVLTFQQAQRKAGEIYEERDAIAAGATLAEAREPLTVARAAEHYLAWYRKERKSLHETKTTIEAHILPKFGERLVSELREEDIKAWHERLASEPARVRVNRLAKALKFRAAAKTDDEKRARKATANRILTVLKALLNKAVEDKLASDDKAWRVVKPFKKVNEPRIHFLTDAEALRLVNACPPDLRRLVQGALLTGARFGELAALRVHDVSIRTRHIYIAQSKSDKPRYISLNAEGVTLFQELVGGKTGEAHVFVKADGMIWGKNHAVRPLAQACRVAKLRPAISFHELRHTYASHLAQAGVSLQIIAKLLGHSDTRITERHYAHLADKTLATAVAQLPSFTSLPPHLHPLEGGKHDTAVPKAQ